MSSPSEIQIYRMSSSPSPLVVSEPEQRSPSPPTFDSTTPKSSQKRPLAEVIGEPFPPFDTKTVVAMPYNEEMDRDAQFQAELNEALLDLILGIHAWASSRPKYETVAAGTRLSKSVEAIQEVEAEQGRSPVPDSPMHWISMHARCLFYGQRTRSKLNEYISCIRTALSALTGMPF